MENVTPSCRLCAVFWTIFFLLSVWRLLETAVRPAVQLLQIQEVHPVPHSNACNFCRFLIYFSYLLYLGHLSLLGLQTKTRR